MPDVSNAATDLTEERLAELTAGIVAAYVSNNSLPPSDLPGMIKSVSESFQRTPSTVEPVSITPAVSVRKSVTPTHITCLICGRPHKTLKRHLGTAHGMNPNDYRAEFGLSRDYPMVAPAYAEARSVMAKRIGLGRKPQAKTSKPVAAFRRKRASKAA